MGSEMCIRDRAETVQFRRNWTQTGRWHTDTVQFRRNWTNAGRTIDESWILKILSILKILNIISSQMPSDPGLEPGRSFPQFSMYRLSNSQFLNSPYSQFLDCPILFFLDSPIITPAILNFSIPLFSNYLFPNSQFPVRSSKLKEPTCV